LPPAKIALRNSIKSPRNVKKGTNLFKYSLPLELRSGYAIPGPHRRRFHRSGSGNTWTRFVECIRRLFAHTEDRDHIACNFGYFLQVIGCAGGNLTKNKMEMGSDVALLIAELYRGYRCVRLYKKGIGRIGDREGGLGQRN